MTTSACFYNISSDVRVIPLDDVPEQTAGRADVLFKYFLKR